jgi:hypothetical protein
MKNRIRSIFVILCAALGAMNARADVVCDVTDLQHGNQVVGQFNYYSSSRSSLFSILGNNKKTDCTSSVEKSINDQGPNKIFIDCAVSGTDYGAELGFLESNSDKQIKEGQFLDETDPRAPLVSTVYALSGCEGER